MTRPTLLAAALLVALGCSDGDEDAPASLVTITSPESPLFVRGGAVHIQVFVDGVPDRVDLYKDGAPLVNLGANGPFEATWSADGAPERVHRFTVRAQFGKRTAESGALEVHVDRTPPRVVTTSPANGAARVPFDTQVRLTFDEAVDPTSLAGAAAFRVAGAPRVGSLEPSGSDPATVVVRFAEPLTGAGAVEVSVGSPLRDRAGNEAVPATFGFTLPVWTTLGGGAYTPPSWAGTLLALFPQTPLLVAQRGWFAPAGDGWREAVPAPPGDALAVAQVGDTLWAAVAQPGSVGVRRRVGAGDWEGPSSVALVNAGFAAEGVGLAILAGRPLLVWSEGGQIDGIHHVRGPYGARLDATGAWQPAAPVDAGWNVALAASGEHALVTWDDATGLHAARWSEAGWVPVGRLSATVLAAAMRPDGHAFVVDAEGSLLELDGSTWRSLGTAIPAPVAPESVGWATLAVLPDGQPAVAWVRWGDGWRELNVAHRMDGRFGVIGRERASGASGGFAFPRLGADASGALLLAWQEGNALTLRRLEP